MSDMVKIRIAVAITDEGEYYACGNNNWNDAEAKETVLEKIDNDCVKMIHFVEVSMPVPKPQTFVFDFDPSKKPRFEDPQRG